MPTQRHLKIFISSTFEDMNKEREVLLKHTFLELKKIAKQRDVEITEIDLRTGVTKEQAENGEVIKICLDEVERCSDSPIFFLGMLGNRYGSVDWIGWVNKDVFKDNRYAWVKDCSDVSITEIEIISALERNKKNNKAFFYLKDGIDDDEKLTNLKKSLIEKSETNSNLFVTHYKDIDDFKEKTIDSFTKALDELYPKDEKVTEVEKLRATHNIFAKSRQKVYITHSKNKSVLDYFMNNEEDRLLLYGESGYGKSALIANYFENFKKESDSFVIEHYIGGAGDLSNDLYQMLRRVMLEIKEEFEVADKVPSEPQKIMNEFALWLHRVKRPTVIVFDGYNQIEDEMKEKLFYYIPDKLKNVKLIITSIKDNYPIDNRYKIEPLTKEDQKELVVDYLKLYGKEGIALKIQNQVTKHPQTDNTLFLRTLLNEIRLLGNFDNVEKDIANYLQAKDTVALFIKIFERLENDYRENLAKEVLSLLYVSRDGLSEDNLMEIINQNTTKNLTRLEFSPLFLAVEEHLIDRDGLYGFFHGYILKAVEKRYLSSEELVNGERKKIANYFEGREIDNQKGRELPFQLFILNDRDRLHNILINIEFFVFLQNKEKYELLRYVKLLDLNNKNTIIENLLESVLSLDMQELSFINDIAVFIDKLYLEPEKSLRIYEKALKISIIIFGEEHYQVATIYNNIANVYSSLSNIDKAITFHKKSIKILKKFCSMKGYEKIIGDSLLARGYNNIAVAYRKQKEYQKSINYLKDALEFSKNNWWAYNEYAYSIYMNLAQSYEDLKEYETAYMYNKEALLIAEKIHGRNYIGVGMIYNNIATILWKAKASKEEIIPIYKASIKIHENTYGKYHPDISLVYKNISDYYFSIGEYDEAMKIFKKLIIIDKKVFSIDSTYMADNYFKISTYYLKNEDYLISFKYMKKALSIYKKHSLKYKEQIYMAEVSLSILKENLDILAQKYIQSAESYFLKKNYEESLLYYKKVIEISMEYFGENHQNTALLLNNQAVVYERLGLFSDSIKIHLQGLEIKKNVFGKEHIEVGNSHHNIAVSYFKVKELKKALYHIENAIQIRLDNLGIHSNELLESQKTFVQIIEAQGK